MFTKVGETVDGKFSVVTGVFSFYETHGLPLDVTLEVLFAKNIVPCWFSFYLEASCAGMKHQRIISKLNEAISDVHGEEFANIICNRLRERFENVD